MTRIWMLSDLHDDYSRASMGNLRLPQDVDADVLVVAGDVAGRLSTMGRDWITAQYNLIGIPILIVPGNHDYWNGSVDREVDRFRERCPYPDIHVLDGEAIELAGTRFVGGTLWTDYAITGDVTIAADAARNGLQDFKRTTTGTGRVRPKVRPQDFREIHIRHRNVIRSTLATPFDGPTVVVTHHAPSSKSLRDGLVTEPLDAAYASDLEDLIVEGAPDLWIHGHVHHRVDYTIGETRIMCNPRGYRHAAHSHLAFEVEVPDFDDALVVEVGSGMRPRIADEPDDDEIQKILQERGLLTDNYDGEPKPMLRTSRRRS